MSKQNKNLIVFVVVMIGLAVAQGVLSVGVDISQVGTYFPIAIPIAYTFWIQKQNIEGESRRE